MLKYSKYETNAILLGAYKFDDHGRKWNIIHYSLISRYTIVISNNGLGSQNDDIKHVGLLSLKNIVLA